MKMLLKRLFKRKNERQELLKPRLMLQRKRLREKQRQSKKKKQKIKQPKRNKQQ